jgi:alpha,alpha-trehalase
LTVSGRFLADRSREAEERNRRAAERAGRINRLMWDDQKGLYFDYDFVHKRVREYPFLTTFYPLWAGIAGREHAERVTNAREVCRPA